MWGADEDEDDDDYRSGVPMMMRRRRIMASLGAASACCGPDRYFKWRKSAVLLINKLPFLRERKNRPQIQTGVVIGCLTAVSVHRSGQVVRSRSLVYRRRLAGRSLWIARDVPTARWPV